MNIGDTLYLSPTIETSAFVMKKDVPQKCTVIAVNEKHDHFTVRFHGYGFCETFKGARA